jgi:Zn-dependent M28 family amino/carboxypeptidase
LLVIAVLATLVALPLSVAQADDIANTKGFRKHVTLAGVRAHQAAFQAFASANGGTRASGTPGYDASAEYVHDAAVAAGLDVSYQEFAFNFFEELSPSQFAQTAPAMVTYVNGTDFLTMDFSGSGDVTAAVTTVDLQLGLGNTSNSGCEAADFAGFPAGNIALVQRGTCTFGSKAVNAEAAGAAGIVIFNQGNTASPDRQALFGGTLGAPVGIPALSTSYPFGVALAGTAGLVLHMTTDTISEVRETVNVIAETPGGDPNRVIVVGAHLDSVSAGPGINDNGSGSATILEIAEVFMAQDRVPRNKLRFMWYGAEEGGLIGSTVYVNSLSQAERDRIELMLNFDMVGSPNFVRFVYDGDNSAFPPGPGVQPGPPGSGAIEQIFLDYFASQGLLNAPTPFSGRSDYGPFITIAGIPAGGLFTGAEGIKTAQQVIDYGGTAGEQYDQCYHQACDMYNNVSLTGLDQMADAAAHAVLYFSKRNFDKEPLANP